jgi:predicted transcriptional regulator
MTTPRMIIIEICNRPGISTKDLAEKVKDISVRRMVDAVKMLARVGVIDVEGEGETATLRSRYAHFEIATSVAASAGLEIDKALSV